MDGARTVRPLGRPVVFALHTVRVVAVLGVLFGVGAAGSSFESQLNRRGQDSGVFGGGVLALLGLKDPPDGDMFPVWMGRLCVVAGVVLTVVLTRVLDRSKRAAAQQAAIPPPPPPPRPQPGRPPYPPPPPR